MINMIPKVIHQIFFDIGKGKTYRHITEYVTGHDKTIKHCEENGIRHKLWNQKEVEELLHEEYPHFVELWENFREPIQRIDFARYMILHNEGGIYLDLDVHPIRDISSLWEKEFFFVRWNNDNKPYNAILGCEPSLELYEDIMEHCMESTYEKQEMEIYEKWKGRLVFQTTGHFMLWRVLKKHKITELLDIISVCNNLKSIWVCAPDAMFIDSNVSIWWEDRQIRCWNKDDITPPKSMEI